MNKKYYLDNDEVFEQLDGDEVHDGEDYDEYEDDMEEDEEVDFDRPSFGRNEIWTDYAEDLDYDQ